MAGRKRCKRGRKSRQDRLSNLPENIIHKILSIMETKQAVQTSVLSKRWQHLWKAVPDLKFNCRLFTRLRAFKKFVLHVLSRRDGNCKVNEFQFHRRGQIDQSLTKKIIQYAVSQNARSLSIQLSDSFFTPSPMLLQSHSLRVLKLGKLYHVTFPASSLFESLTALHLNECSFHYDKEDQCFDPFANCQNLKTLEVNRCKFWGRFKIFKISQPNLTSLTLSSMRYWWELPKDCKVQIFAPKLSFFCFASTSPLCFSMLDISALQSVNIDLQVETHPGWIPSIEQKEKANRNLIHMFQGLRDAKFVTLSFETIMVLTWIPGMLESQPSPFHRLKLLKIRLPYAHNSSQMPAHVITYLLGDFCRSTTLELEPPKE